MKVKTILLIIIFSIKINAINIENEIKKNHQKAVQENNHLIQIIEKNQEKPQRFTATSFHLNKRK